MPRYRVHLQTIASVSLEVEATDKDEAYDLAAGRTPSICGQCSGWGRDYSLDLNDDWEIPGDDIEEYVEKIED